jgi:RNA polymerase sigma factor (sigma-70 family)
MTMVPASSEEDRRLAARVLEDGDEAAFTELYRRHSGRVYAVLLRLCARDRALADDLLQDTWLRAATGLERFRWDSSLLTWLRAIATNCWREHLRGMRNIELFDEATHAAPDARAMGAESIDVERALAALDPGYRAVLVLHDIEGLTHEEIGTALGVTAGTSRAQLFHARRAMRAHLGGERS